jgi:hypothetical protein
MAERTGRSRFTSDLFVLVEDRVGLVVSDEVWVGLVSVVGLDLEAATELGLVGFGGLD